MKKGIAVGLGIVGAVSALRGTAKVLEHYKEKWDARRKFERGEWVDMLACNIHAMVEDQGKSKLEIFTFATPKLENFIPNRYAEERFLDAAAECDEHQPFPTLNFPQDKYRRYDGLNRTNKFLRESFSSLYQEGIIAAGLGLPTLRGEFYLVPTCQIWTRGNGIGRALTLEAVPKALFESLGDNAEVERLKAENPRHAARIAKLASAFCKHERYGILHGEDDELFPKVTVVIKR